MKLFILPVLICLLTLNINAENTSWKAKRITLEHSQNETNTWINFRKDIELEVLPDRAIAKIATDSKYWLWINGQMVVYEGLLKRGPNPQDTYYDEVDIAPYLKSGANTVAVLTWYFGKDGFSHKSSGQAGLAFECNAIDLYTDHTWHGKLNKAFEKTVYENPNYRLPESNIRFNAQIDDFEWVKPGADLKGFTGVVVSGEAESAPWNKLWLRPIPQWKDYGIRNYENDNELPNEGTGEWIECRLPYNCHAHPILDIEAPAGLVIRMQTDNFDYMGLNVASVRAEYITKEGRQQYESLGWMNGHVMKYMIPKGVKINSLTYRETGYDCEFTGYFNSNDPFYDKLWQMAVRTLYVTMRDTYMDCPDRERAQWWGDVVNESGEAFYALSPSSSAITKKGILELINWQRPDGIIYSPVPEGNWNKELPGQMLASVGHYGFWNYYMNTSDKETIEKVYDGVRRYLDVWELEPDGTLVHREGGWYWGDWGVKIDKQLLYNAWYYIALKGYLQMSELVGRTDEVQRITEEMAAFKVAFNKVFWDGIGYRTDAYEGEYDDRAQALAVVGGLADEDKYPLLLDIFKSSYLASPYMEKYVLEALFKMGEPDFGLARMKDRYYRMVEESPFTTLYENFGPPRGEQQSEAIGYGTNNHAWSGGGLTILSQYVCGLEPIEPGWKSFKVKPQLGILKYAETGNETVAGRVEVKVNQDKTELTMELAVPEGSNAIVYIPAKLKRVIANKNRINSDRKEDDYNLYRFKGGTYNIVAR